MGSRRFWLGSCAGILAVLLLLGSYAGYRVQRLLDEQGMTLDWQRLNLSLRGLQLDDLLLERHGDAPLRLHAASLRLHWLATEAPRYRLLLQGLRLDWQPAEAAEDDADNDLAQTLRQLGEVLPWLPRRIELEDVQARLPCASGRCTLQGDTLLSRQDDSLRLHVRLPRGAHRAELRAELQGLAPSVDSPRQLRASLHLDDQPQLDLDTRVQPDADGLQWHGELSMPQLGEVDWLGEWLSEWLLLAPEALASTPRQARLNAQWQLQLAQDAWQPQQLLAAPGWLRLDVLLDQPWPLPALGLVSGELALDLRSAAGRWQARQLQGDLVLEPQGAPWLAGLPSELQASRLRLRIQPLDPAPGDDLALQLLLDGQGPLQLQGEAELGLSQPPDWTLALRQFRLEARGALNLADTRLDGLRLALQLSGSASPERLAFSLGRGSTFSVEGLRHDELQVHGLQAELGDIQLQGTLQAPSLAGPLALRVQRLQHPRLQAQGWQWQGRLHADGDRQTLDGPLLADSGLHLALKLARDARGELNLNATLAELFLRAGNPLPQTLADWPPLLSLDNGRLQGDARLDLPPGQPLRLLLNLTARGLSGIYDRSTLSGIDGEARLQLDGDHLDLQLPNLSAKALDPGIALGPLQLQGDYQASLNAPLAGRLRHQRAELGILGGSLSLAPATWALDQPSQLLPLRLAGLDLQELFRVYPAEGLAGSGLLDGTLPLRLGDTVGVEQGLIEARAPGGRLSFHSPRIHAMGLANPGMKLVTDALEDFHYDLLSSSLDYEPSGTLRLGMRLQGRNPAIEQGRPIHFNINLEEDIPTLLASLQLTGKVSEIIQQRIQQRMRQSPITQDSKE